MTAKTSRALHLDGGAQPAPALGIADAPWLPCRWCGWMPIGCTCAPVPKEAWETALRMSEAARTRDRSVAEWIQLHAAWAAA